MNDTPGTTPGVFAIVKDTAATSPSEATVTISRTNTRRYVALCDWGGCGWSDGPHGLRLVVSERLRHHMKQTHGITVTEGTPMKTPTDDLPDQESGPKLKDYDGQLIVLGAGWTDDNRNTKFGERRTIEADLYAYNPETKTWDDVGRVPVFFQTVQKQMREAGNQEDIGAVLIQGTERNSREWHLAPPSKAQSAILAKFDHSAF